MLHPSLLPAGAVAAGLLLAPLAPARAQAPTLTTISPAANARAVPRNASVVATFSQPLTAASAGALKVYSNQWGGLRSAAATVTGNTLSFAPTAYDFRPGETVQVTVTRTAAGTGGPLATPRVQQFTTAVGGTGRGTFALGYDLPSINQPSGVALGDVTGDNLPDMLAANKNGSTLSVYAGDGLGSYFSRQDLPVGISPADVALGDLDGDGDLDFVTANFTSGTLSVRLNNGFGLFAPPTAVPEPMVNGNPNSLALGDVDGDGDLDVVVSGINGISLVRLLNDGAGNFASRFTLGGNGDAGDVALGDVDSDGDLDAVVTCGAVTVAVYLNSGTGTFTAPINLPLSGGPLRLALGDVDADGLPDVVVSCASSSTVCIGHNIGGGRFTFGQPLPVPMRPQGVVLGDLDADGDLDFVVVSFTQRISTWFNDGTGIFSNGSSLLAAGNLDGLALGDVDNDGDLDLLTTSYGTNTLLLRLNGGTGPLATAPGASSASLTAYPNPAAGRVTLTLPPAATRAELLDALGRVVRVVPAPAGTTTLDVAGLAPGFYLVRAAGQVAHLVVE